MCVTSPAAQDFKQPGAVACNCSFLVVMTRGVSLDVLFCLCGIGTFRTTDSTGNAELGLASGLQKQRPLCSTRTKSHLHQKPNLRTVDYLCHAGTRHVLTTFTATTTSRNPQTSFFLNLSICLSSHIHTFKKGMNALAHARTSSDRSYGC